MSEPKFQVGQLVAVCTRELDIVIPATTVTRLQWQAGRVAIQNGRSVPCSPHWAYAVTGWSNIFCEWCLRPIDSDEYTESEEEKERTA